MKFNKRKVLVAPLDWGLGHATRCIPLIRVLLSMDCQVLIAAEKDAAYLLRQEFPQLPVLELKGYRVSYSRSRLMLPLKIGMQVPKIMAAIKHEHRWLEKVIDEHNIDLVISDNRYGLYTEKVPCIFITHQLNIKAPYRWMEKKMRQLNFKYISRFTECWVPDIAKDGLAGELSHLKELHLFPVKYIGPLSRFKKVMAPVKYQLLFLTSGPEPQRTLLEKIIFRDVLKLKGEILIVRGKPGSNETFSFPPNITVANHLEGQALELAMNSAELIISRAGYTTIMEVAGLHKTALLIPTPGQTEQEYLAAYLNEKGFAFTADQKGLDLVSTLQTEEFLHREFPVIETDIEKTVQDFLQKHFKTELAEDMPAN